MWRGNKSRSNPGQRISQKAGYFFQDNEGISKKKMEEKIQKTIKSMIFVGLLLLIYQTLQYTAERDDKLATVRDCVYLRAEEENINYTVNNPGPYDIGPAELWSFFAKECGYENI